MSTDYLSKDGRWRVRAIVLNGAELLRVEHDSPFVNGKLVRHWGGTAHRYGPERTGAGWYRIEDVTSVQKVAEYVPLDQLTQANP